MAVAFQMTRLFTLSAAALLATAISACTAAPPERTDATNPDIAGLPVILMQRDDALAMEALVSGSLVREGPCIYLHTGARRELIVWGDDVRAGKLDGDGWLVTDYTTNERFLPGDMLQGGGGAYPEDADLALIADPAPPAECAGPAVQLYDVHRIGDSPLRTPPGPPPPPPPPGAGLAGSPVAPSTRPDVLEALFRHQFANNASGQQKKAGGYCLEVAGTDPDAAFLSRFAGTNPTVYPASDCTFDDVQYTLRATGQPAIVHFVSALSCSATACEARGGYREGNLSSSVNRYRLEYRGGRWQVVQDVMEAIS